MRYRTIVADPPWNYPEGHITQTATGRTQDVKRYGSRAVLGSTIRRALPYPSMSLSEIRSIPIQNIAERDARLFLWTTNRYLPDAFEVIDTWGFRYRQTLVWHKADVGRFPASVAAPTAEFLLVAAIGSPKRTGTLPSSVIKINHPKRHSVKPEAFLDLVESVSPGPYVELFARRNRLGWDTWGNEALEHVAFAQSSGGTT